MANSIDKDSFSNASQDNHTLNNAKLKNLWNNLINLNSNSKFDEESERVYEECVLILNTFLEFYKKVNQTLRENKLEQQSLKKELTCVQKSLQLKQDELNCQQSIPCFKCPELEREVSSYRKRLAQNESRIKSIANILNLQGGSQNSEDPDVGSERAMSRAFTLMSQMLLGPRGDERDCKPNLLVPDTLVPESQSLAPCPITRNCVVPETLCPDDPPLTPKKQFILRKRKDQQSPVLGNVGRRAVKLTKTGVKTRQSSQESEPCMLSSPSLLKETTEMPKALIQDALSIEQISREPVSDEVNALLSKQPPKSGQRSLQPDVASIKPSSKCSGIEDIDSSVTRPPQKVSRKLETDLSTVISVSPDDAVEKLNPDDTISNPPLRMLDDRSDSGRGKRKCADYWQLKTTCNLDADIIPLTKGSGRKLKQTQLALGCFAKKRDICTLKEFNGGIRQTSTQLSSKPGVNTDDVAEDELLARAIQESLKEEENHEDIVLESPNASNASGKMRRHVLGREASLQTSENRKVQDVDETCFSPGDEHMSPRLLLDELAQPDSSFNRLPKKPATSPKFKYRRDTVRKREERQKLDGWDCDQCSKYYEAAGRDLSKGQMKAHMNRCSRHRDKYVRPTTPPGFWDAEFPTTQECRALNLDVTVVDAHRKRARRRTDT